MKILFCGDVVGRSGRSVIEKNIPVLRKSLSLDFVIVNAENAAHGFGLTPKMFEAFKRAGVDAVTMGNHTFDKKDIFDTLADDEKLIRPLNYPEGTVGHGMSVFCLSDGRKIAVVQVLGRLFMRPSESPFMALENFFKTHILGQDIQALIVDVHAEATSEKMALGFFCDGRASLVAGTHTHIPTADAMILPNGTGFISDVGMCGDYYSIIGMTKETALPRFLNRDAIQETGEKSERLEPAEKEGTLCGVFIETDDKTGKCLTIRPIRLGAHLINT